MSAGVAALGGWVATELLDITDDLTALDGGGWWAVALPFEGPPVLARFARLCRAPVPASRGCWPGVDSGSWRSGLDQPAFESGVRAIRSVIGCGGVYQVNLTRRLSASLPAGANPFGMARGLAGLLAERHPAPHAGHLVLPSRGLAVVSASPERFLRRDGRLVLSQPIKGTTASSRDDGRPATFGEKDRAENVMIVDLVRNDFGRVCEPGSVTVPVLFDQERHPGLVHLVSSVRGRLAPGVGWPELLAATFPPGSVTGAPKLAAREIITALERGPRGPYCGALGWVDADRGVGDLNVAIRTFWFAEGELHFGTGGGITWSSRPAGEWEETVLKSRRLIAAVAQPW
ncbi:MAG: chorismate-binding protein [Actinomycetota bacterium]|nr:chorismate-binding protein [Actinomycetota bacterium]